MYTTSASWHAHAAPMMEKAAEDPRRSRMVGAGGCSTQLKQRSAMQPSARQRNGPALQHLSSARRRRRCMCGGERRRICRRRSRETGARCGVLVEVDRTERIFTNPANERTEAYVTGRFG